MTYHDLSECTLSPDERVAEAIELVNMIDKATMPSQLTEAEYKFVETVLNSGYVSVKQLFWLRDIKDKYL